MNVVSAVRDCRLQDLRTLLPRPPVRAIGNHRSPAAAVDSCGVYEYQAHIARVIDGDTVDVMVDLGLRVHCAARLRLNGLNAAEKNTAAGKDALAYLAALLPADTLVTIRTFKEPSTGDDQTEKYGRWLADIQLGTVDVNAELIETGHALPWDGKGQRPT